MELLTQLMAIDSPSGDEDVMADWISEWTASNIPGARQERLGESLVVVRGDPRTAVFAHIDTTGFTLGYGNQLVWIGRPSPKDGDRVRALRHDGHGGGVVRVKGEGNWTFEPDRGGPAPAPGDRLVYAAAPAFEGGWIVGPYLDNRGGVWAALRALERCNDIAVAFTCGEEHSGKGAAICARYLFEEHGVRQALISDLTWDTEHVHCCQGVAVSLRDSLVPRQRFVKAVRRIAEGSGIQHQLEVESAGGSDGGPIQRSGYPIDWVFIGAPEVAPHTAAERVHKADLATMVDMLAILVQNLVVN